MDTPQFKKAEFAAPQRSDICKQCGQPVGPSYFRVDGAMACPACAEKSRLSIPPDRHSAFGRALFFGIGAAIVGLAGYAIFAIMTGIVIGYLSLGVGFIIAKAMMAGSRGVGGRRYQIAAAVLTYAAVSMAAIPISISVYAKAHPHGAQPQTQSSATTDENASVATAASDGSSAPKPPMNFGGALITLGAIGLASPFLDLFADPFHGLIGLVILLVGIRIAWKMTRGSGASGERIVGPFRNQAAAAPPALG